jgi:hypothetical protein
VKGRGDEANAGRRRRGARCSEMKAEKAGATGAKCRGKDSPCPPLRFIDPWSHAPRIARSACINCRRTTQSLTSGTHHDQSGQAHARARSLRCGNRRAAAGRHVRPPTSPTTRAASAPEKARPQCTTVDATVGIKWPSPLPSKDDPRAARAQGLKSLTLEGCDYRPVASKPAQRERVPQVPSIYKDY